MKPSYIIKHQEFEEIELKVKLLKIRIKGIISDIKLKNTDEY